MAGNTKLMGFTPEGHVVLERWGGRALVALSQQDLEAIRAACHRDLPKAPKQLRQDHLEDFSVRYEETIGRVLVGLDPVAAETLASIIGLTEFADQKIADQMKGWRDALLGAVQQHADYINRNEPGVD